MSSRKNGIPELPAAAFVVVVFLIFYTLNNRYSFFTFETDSKKNSSEPAVWPVSPSLQPGGALENPTTVNASQSEGASPAPPAGEPENGTSEQENLSESFANCAQRIDAQIDQSKRLKIKVQGKLFPWLLSEKDNSMGNLVSASQGLTFLKALALADLIQGRSLPGDNLAAIKLFNRLLQSEPSNSAFLAYLAIVYEKTNEIEKMNETLAKIPQATYFNTYFMQVTQIIYEQVQIPTEFLEAISMAAGLPIINYIPLNSLIKKHKLVNVAKQMVMANYSTPMCSDLVDCMIIEYVIGVKALKFLGVEHQFPDAKTYIREASKKSQLFGQDFEDVITKECDARGLIPLLEKFKAYKSPLPSFPKRHFSLAE